MRRSILFGVVLAVVGTGVAMATPGLGVSAEILARGGVAEPVEITADAQTDVVMQHITIAPRGHTGWHSHPGPAMVIVTEGALTLYSADDPACRGTTYRAGRAFVDPGRGHIHIGRNERRENVELFVTYFNVPLGGSFRIDAADPGNCNF